MLSVCPTRTPLNKRVKQLKLYLSSSVRTVGSAEVQKSWLPATHNVFYLGGRALKQHDTNRPLLKDAEIGFKEMNSVRIIWATSNIHLTLFY